MKKWPLILLLVLIVAVAGVWMLTSGFQIFTQPNTNDWQLALPDTLVPVSGSTPENNDPTPASESTVEAQTSDAPEAVETEETAPSEKQNEDMASVVAEEDEREVRLPESGTLVFQIRGKNQGKETYQFSRLPDDGFQAFAEGELTTEVALIPFSFAYRQLLKMDDQFQPTYFATELKGPLGLGNQSTSVQFSNNNATLATGRDVVEFEVAAEKLVIINMFSTFALFPLLFELGSPLATFQALDAGGFDESGEFLSGSNYRLGTMALQQLNDLELRVGEEKLMAQRYLLKIAGPQDNYQLLYHQGRWIGVVGEVQDDQGGLFIVYRSDLYPNGFEVVASPF